MNQIIISSLDLEFIKNVLHNAIVDEMYNEEDDPEENKKIRELKHKLCDILEVKPTPDHTLTYQEFMLMEKPQKTIKTKDVLIKFVEDEDEHF